MSTNDHVSTAKQLARRAMEVSVEDGHAQLNATLALAHATLALVEEQRTTNLLTAVANGHHLGFDHEDEAWDFATDTLRLPDDVKEA